MGALALTLESIEENLTPPLEFPASSSAYSGEGEQAMTNATMLLGFVLSTSSWAGERSLTVCLAPSQTVEYDQILAQAKGYAMRLYRLIGVDLRWKATCSSTELETPGTLSAPNLSTIGVEWAAIAPATLPAGARASAHPFQATGIRITLYQDRIFLLVKENHRGAAVLGHVLAHEIGHVLLGHNAHGRKGLMQPAWSNLEQSAMRCTPMAFTTEEAESIRRRLDNRMMLAGVSSPRLPEQ